MSADRDDWETISALLSDVESHKTICGSTIITGQAPTVTVIGS